MRNSRLLPRPPALVPGMLREAQRGQQIHVPAAPLQVGAVGSGAQPGSALLPRLPGLLLQHTSPAPVPGPEAELGAAWLQCRLPDGSQARRLLKQHIPGRVTWGSHAVCFLLGPAVGSGWELLVPAPPGPSG